MGTTFGMFTNNQGGVVFNNLHAYIVDGPSNHNHPENPDSPNVPRVANRYPGLPNPILGDPGKYGIGGFSTVSMDALVNVINQMIEQYLRDKQWYSKVRCREALWNMYRRIEWWVKNEVDPSKHQYEQVLNMIKDCINKILNTSSQWSPNDLTPKSLPYCPAPYYQNFNADYFNHFDGRDVERVTFSFSDSPLLDQFPDQISYVSSLEDQEWTLVHSVGGDETQGNQNILKLDLNILHNSNASKLTFNWRFKKRGYVKFKFLASAAKGNGLLFFINSNQVGGEWNHSSDWQEVSFNVSPGQTYKFDWLVRKQSEEVWGYNAIYIKDIQCVEVIRSTDSPAPPDYDTLGAAANSIKGYDWLMHSKSSVIRAEFSGAVVDGAAGNRVRTYIAKLDNECDGVFSFAYRMGTQPPHVTTSVIRYFTDNFCSRSQSGTSQYGSTATAAYDNNWTMNCNNDAETQADGAKVVYHITVGQGATVSVNGLVEMVCPPQVIDHYEPKSVGVLNTLPFTFSGNNRWFKDTNGYLIMNDPILQGSGSASTNVYLQDDGWFTFSFNHQLRPSESFEVLVDGNVVHHSEGDSSGTNVRVDLKAGYHTITFQVTDSLTEQPVSYHFYKKFSYGSGSQGSFFYIPDGHGNSVTVTRNWNVQDAAAYTETSGSTINYDITLVPGATFNLDEILQLYPRHWVGDDPTQNPDPVVFSDYFNTQNEHDPRLYFSSGWEWEDISKRFGGDGGDGVWKVEGHPQPVNTIDLSAYMPDNGYVYFEYGGQFNTYDNLELWVDGNLVWSGNQNTTGPIGNKVIVPLSRGGHSLRWVYNYRAGVPVTVDDSGNVIDPNDPYKDPNPQPQDQCYPRGDNIANIDYSVPYYSTEYDPGFKFSTSGWNVKTYTNNGAPYAVGLDTNDSITRNLINTSFTGAEYNEILKVYAGTQGGGTTTVTQTGQINVKLHGFNETPDKDYYCMRLDNVAVGSWKFLYSDPFDASNSVRIFWEDHSTLGVFDDGVATDRNRYVNGYVGFVRGVVKAFLVPASEFDPDTFNPDNYTPFYLMRGNVGEPVRYNELTPSDFLVRTDWQQRYNPAPYWFLPEHVPDYSVKVDKGKYVLVFAISDTCADADYFIYNGQKYDFHYAIRDLRVVTTYDTVVDQPPSYDDTYVLFEVYDIATGQLVTSTRYSNTNNLGPGVSQYSVSCAVPVGKSYQVRMTLVKGSGSGGRMTLHGGNIDYFWVEYCKDANGNYYPKDPNYRSGGTTTVTTNPIGTEWCWIDTIDLRVAPNPICADASVHVLAVDDSGSVYVDQTYTNTSPQDVRVAITNNTDHTKHYSLRMTFNSSCGDGAKLYGGRFWIDTVENPTPSYVQVTDFNLIRNQPVWMGGCNGSKIHVNVYSDVDNSLLKSFTFGEGLQSYDVIGTTDLPYSKYRVEIVTEQHGQVSSVTGKSYLTTFRNRYFQATEYYTFQPVPFNGKLEFYIDNQLMATYTNPTQNFVAVQFPVSKGVHEYKFVYTDLNNNVSQDFCEIDWIDLTNWICDKVLVIPHCEPGGGDKCVEALIKCLQNIVDSRPKACVIGKRIWLFT